jgi:hypothetical protein
MSKSLVSLSEVAEHFGISRTAARDLEIQNVIDRAAGLTACRLAYIRHLRERRSSHSEADAQLRAARAREIEIRIAERERKLIPLGELNFAWDFCLGVLVTNLASVPARSTRDLVLRRTIEHEIDLARNAAADACRKQNIAQDAPADRHAAVDGDQTAGILDGI